jgi:hypothetical protein
MDLLTTTLVGEGLPWHTDPEVSRYVSGDGSIRLVSSNLDFHKFSIIY